MPKTLQPTGPVGSPIGFRMLISTLKTQNDDDGMGPYEVPSQSGLYPIIDPGSIFRSPRIGSYNIMRESGTLYVVARSEDANGVQDNWVRVPRDDWEVYATNPVERARQIFVHDRILKFYVNKTPFFDTSDGTFYPRPNGTDSLLTRSSIPLHLPGDDIDPFNPEDLQSAASGGGPTTAPGGSISKVLRWSVRLRGTSPTGDPVVYLLTPEPIFNDPSFEVDIPPDFPGTRGTLEAELCDCAGCEGTPGQGRCVKLNIPIKFPPPTAAFGSSPEHQTRPGSFFGGRSIPR
jgi:hypothetical protein